MDALQQRLLQVIDKLGLKKSQFEKNVGLSNGFVDKAGDNTRKSSLNKISKKYPEIDIDWIKTGKGNMMKNDTEVEISQVIPVTNISANTVPLLPISAQGGSFNDFVASVKEIDCEKVISPVKGAELAITVSGDSMAPEFPNGCQVLIKRINEDAFIEWGKVYVLDTCNGTVIKEIHKGQNNEEIECFSINPDPKFQPFSVKRADIYGMYKVIMCMSLK